MMTTKLTSFINGENSKPWLNMAENTIPVNSTLKNAKKPIMPWNLSLLSIGKNPTRTVVVPEASNDAAPKPIRLSAPGIVFRLKGTTRLNPPYKIVDTLKMDRHGSSEVARKLTM